MGCESRFTYETGMSFLKLLNEKETMKYQQFLKQVEKENEIFASRVKDRLPSDLDIIELAYSRETAVSNHLENHHTHVVETNFEVPTLSDALKPKGEGSFFLLANGLSITLMDYLPLVLSSGNFVLGFCAERGTAYFKTCKTFYRKLQSDLHIPKEEHSGTYPVYLLKGGRK